MMTDFDFDELPESTPEETDAPDSVTVQANGFSLSFNLPQLLEAVDQRAHRWHGYGDEEQPEPVSLRNEVASVAGNRLAKDLVAEVRTEVKNHVRDAVSAQVSEIVAEALNNPVQRTNEWGGAVGDPKSLRELIMEQATDLLKVSRDPYRSSQQSSLQQIIATQVTQAFTKDLVEVTEQARKEALAAVKESAASVIAETIKRASRGL